MKVWILILGAVFGQCLAFGDLFNPWFSASDTKTIKIIPCSECDPGAVDSQNVKIIKIIDETDPGMPPTMKKDPWAPWWTPSKNFGILRIIREKPMMPKKDSMPPMMPKPMAMMAPSRVNILKIFNTIGGMGNPWKPFAFRW